MLEVFAQCQDEWEWFIPPMGGRPLRLRLNLKAVRDITDAHGLTWNWELVRRLKACARVMLAEEREASERAGKKRETKKRRRKDPVN